MWRPVTEFTAEDEPGLQEDGEAEKHEPPGDEGTRQATSHCVDHADIGEVALKRKPTDPECAHGHADGADEAVQAMSCDEPAVEHVDTLLPGASVP